MRPETGLRAEMLALVPFLRAFAHSLAGNRDRADDLVQDTLLRGLANLERFEPGTSMSAWLCTIMRNAFYSEYRKRKAEVEDPDGKHAIGTPLAPTQLTHLAFAEFNQALSELPPQQREAMYLIDVLGTTLEEAAIIMEVALGTAKSRVIRARANLIGRLQPEGTDSPFYVSSVDETRRWQPP